MIPRPLVVEFVIHRGFSKKFKVVKTKVQGICQPIITYNMFYVPLALGYVYPLWECEILVYRRLSFSVSSGKPLVARCVLVESIQSQYKCEVLFR